MTSRRDVIRALVGAGVAVPMFNRDAFAVLRDARTVARSRSPEALASDEDFWGEIQRAFDVDRTMINLNNGGISPAPASVIAQLERDIRFTNELPTIHNWQVLQPRMETTRVDLAKAFGCAPDEMAVVRNASEALETMILGLDLQRGDEVIVTNQNYGRMVTTWEQRERRDGIVIKRISFKVPPPSDKYIVDQFAAAITPRTKVIEVTHITNLTGQILPVRDIVRMAKPRGIEVFVDGAHAFAHFPFTRDELECDYYGTSLHKWLHAPIGAGFLYVRREKIEKLWSLMGSSAAQVKDIRKYEEIGTHPQANFNAISTALSFHHQLGPERKIARLRWLRDYWANALLKESPRVKVLTPLGANVGGAIALVNVEGIESSKLQSWLYDKHRIVTVTINHDEFNGLRITPSVYTARSELDRFVEEMTNAIRKGI
ncbi:MAG TPA: aminotransferase class V-fold PLP-dependent enzyme [Gemmatimonadaceae bacterium]|nr:aminotransferase class V-fold PLP-dependent enzyme [Gemmatimonadaceae bacterium]